MKYTAVLAVLFSVVSAGTQSGGCEEGTTVTWYSDYKCTILIDTKSYVISEEEVTQIKCAIDKSGKNSYKLNCDVTALHHNVWPGSKICTGSHTSTNLKWGKCTNAGKYWKMV